jgi:hypothetical protein
MQINFKIVLYAQDILKMEVDKDDELSISKEWDKQEEQCQLVEMFRKHLDFISIENRTKETINNVEIDIGLKEYRIE